MPPNTPSESDTKIRLSGPRDRAERPFDLRPDADTSALLAEELGVTALRKLRLSGRVRPSGGRDWVLDAVLGATVVQPCGVTLDPVTTRIDVPVARRYLAAYDAASQVEQEMPEETGDEPLPAVLDLMALLAEELALAIPPFPRSEGAAPLDAQSAPRDAEPIVDEDLKPFAGLKDALNRGKD